MAQGLYKTKSPFKQAAAAGGAAAGGAAAGAGGGGGISKFLGAIPGDILSSGVSGLTSIAGGIIGGKKRRQEQRDAKAENERNKARFNNLDTSNLASNLDNAYEDLSVNTQAADMALQGSQQNQANVMSSMGGAAGGSGIAAMAQALAGTGNQQAQQASASIANQEQSNQLKAAAGRSSIQNAELAGASEARQLEQNKTETLFGMSQQRLGAANEARSAATASIMSGIGQITGAAGETIDAAGN